ncbi:MAG: PLP-dependent transferase [Proteobacteria bacterium]|nr:PLP-dependent transferase [Pseudomonadota bacterium]MYJ95303.1 PLP-dependent transferase [Pseudomonadota bacterium]
MKKETRLAHHPRAKLPRGNESLVEPVYRSVKFTYEDIASSLTPEARDEGFDYTRDANPTTRQLEQLTAELQGRDDAVCVSTGMASAWLAALGNLRAGDRIVCFLESYRPIRVMVRQRLSRLGISHSLPSVHDLQGLEEIFAADETRCLIFEAPTNPMVQVPDIGAITSLARAHGVSTILDNTFGGLHNHGQFEIDYYIHSLTKYASGHGDVMGGVVIADRERLGELKPLATNMGATLDPGAAFLILRGLRTYALRYRRHSESALALADFLSGHPRVERVFYPGLKDDPGHELASKQMGDGYGCVLSFDLRGDGERAWKFIDALELFATVASIGSTESLVAPVKLYFAGDLSEEECARAGIGDNTVRLAVGLEDPGDLIADLEQAFAAAFG